MVDADSGKLAGEADVVLIDDNTIAIIPKLQEGDKDVKQGKPSAAADVQDAAGRLLETHLVFAADGRLQECRIVDPESKMVLWRTIFEADGRVRILDGNDQELLVVDLKRQPAEAPDLKPDLSNVVVLPMPIRSADYLLKQKAPADEQPNFSALSKNELMSLFLADMAQGNGPRVAKLIHDHFMAKGDMRDGFYVLLSRFPSSLTWQEDVEGTDGRKRKVDLRPSAEGSQLRQFVRQHISR